MVQRDPAERLLETVGDRPPDVRAVRFLAALDDRQSVSRRAVAHPSPPHLSMIPCRGQGPPRLPPHGEIP